MENYFKRGDIVMLKDKTFGIVCSHGNISRTCVLRLNILNNKIFLMYPKDARPKSFSNKNLKIEKPKNWTELDISQLTGNFKTIN